MPLALWHRGGGSCDGHLKQKMTMSTELSVLVLRCTIFCFTSRLHLGLPTVHLAPPTARIGKGKLQKAAGEPKKAAGMLCLHCVQQASTQPGIFNLTNILMHHSRALQSIVYFRDLCRSTPHGEKEYVT